MRERARRAPAPIGGFGLVELLAALLIASIVTVAIITVFTRSLGSSYKTMGSVESRQQARLALQMLERDIRMAGSGWGRMKVDGMLSGAQVVYYGIQPGFGGSGNSDSLHMMGNWGASTTLRAAMGTAGAVIQCNSTTGFSVGDLCVVTNGNSAHLFQVTAVSSSPANLSHDTSSPYNANSGYLDWPASGYGIGDLVLKADRVAYRVDPTGYRRPCLVRQENSRAPEVVAWDVNSFTMSYLLQDGSVTRDPDTVTVIARVIPSIRNQVNATQVDSAQVEIRPRAF